MQIIIPMTGHGSRFKSAGYSRLKPFIEVDGKPIIEWIVKLFPQDEDKITFITRREHIETLPYVQTELERIAPKARIAVLDDWEKQGPLADVLRISKDINDSEPTIVSYCDYYMHWDYHQFKKQVEQNQCDGAIPCYSGFHPNLIPKKNLYASCKVDEQENLIELREKFTWHEDKRKTRHSPGLYYFRKGAILKKYCKQTQEAKDHINNEYYMSLPYNYLVKDNLKVWCPVNVSHFCQWGTPEDLNEYLFWTQLIRKFVL